MILQLKKPFPAVVGGKNIHNGTIILSILTILLNSLSTYSQGVTVKIRTDNDEYAVNYVLPLLNTYSYNINEEEAFPLNNVLNLKVDNLSRPCFSMINYGQKGQLYLILEPNDTLEIYFKKNALSNYSKKDSSLDWVEFKGNKSNLYRALNTGILQVTALSKRFKIHNREKKISSISGYTAAIDDFLNKQLIIMDNICATYHTNNEFKKMARAAVICQVIAGVELNVSGSYFDGSNTEQETIHDELRVLLFEKYKTQISDYIEQVPLGLQSFQNYLWQSEGRKLDDADDESYILPVYNEKQGRRAFQLLPKNLQMSVWAGEILASNKNSPNANRVNMAIAKYELQYPNSPYTPVLKRKLQFNEVRLPTYSIIDLSAKSKDFTELISENIPNSNAYFFVDLWATWCGGCKVDFRKYPEIMPFFDENNIKCLFISIDEEGKKGEWESMVNGFMMQGYHTRASEGLKQVLNKKIFKGQVSIPRYFLIDSKGKIIKEFEDGLRDIPLLKNRIKKLI